MLQVELPEAGETRELVTLEGLELVAAEVELLEVTKADDKAIAIASKLAKKRAEALAAVFGVELDEVLKLSYNTYKTKESSYEDAFDECELASAPMMAESAYMNYRAAPSLPVDPKMINKVEANVHVTFKIKAQK